MTYESFSAPQRITSWPLTNSFKTTPQQKPQNQVPTLAPAACWFSTQCLKHRKRASAANRIGSWQWRLSMTSTPKENLNEIGTCICHMVYGFMQIRSSNLLPVHVEPRTRRTNACFQNEAWRSHVWSVKLLSATCPNVRISSTK